MPITPLDVRVINLPSIRLLSSLVRDLLFVPKAARLQTTLPESEPTCTTPAGRNNGGPNLQFTFTLYARALGTAQFVLFQRGCTTAFTVCLNQSQVDSFWCCIAQGFVCRVIRLQHPSICALSERSALGASWAFSFQPVLPPVNDDLRWRFGRASKIRLLQLHILGFGFFQDGDVGVGVFPEGKKIQVCAARHGRLSR